MSRYLTLIGITITFLYLVVFFIGVEGRLSQIKTMELNNLGDFFAGAFGPLAILWLILGYLQQGRELRQNTEALRLQAKELEHAVKAQKEIAEISRDKFEHELIAFREEQFLKNESLKPKFVITEVISTLEPLREKNDFFMIEVSLKNMGNTAKNILFESADKRVDEIFKSFNHSCPSEAILEYSFRINYNPRERHEEVKLLFGCMYDFEGKTNESIEIEFDLTNIESEKSGVIAVIK